MLHVIASYRIGMNTPWGYSSYTQPGRGGIYPLGGIDKTLLTEEPLSFDFFLFKLFRRIKMWLHEMEKLLVRESITTLRLNSGPKALNFASEQL